MKLPRDLSGQSLVRALCRNWDYRQIHQVGSHRVLETDDPAHQRIVVPDHSTLRVETLNAILCAVARHTGVSRDDIISSL